MAEILNGVKQPWKVIKIKGEEGNTSLTINIFKRSATKPTTPTGGTFSNPFPSGWYDGIPQENGNPAWLSTRIFSSNGGYPQQDYWSEPTKIIDTSVVDYEFSSFNGESPGTPSSPLNGATWHNDATIDDIWMAISQISNGVRGPWTVAKIKGEGSPGQGVYKSIVYKRSSDNSPITVKPVGGTFLAPVPLDWNDGIPSGVGIVYQSSRIFTSDGQYPQEEEWGTPIIAVDNEFKDYAYSSLPNKPSEPLNTQGPIQDDATWHNNPTENDIWQAVRDVRNGVYGNWTIQKIKGEDGTDGSQGLTGSTGPSPRTFEWVVGTQYQYGDGYIDYIYYRGTGESDPCRGWYIVKPNPTLSKTTAIANSGGCPNLTLFEKQPFTNNMSFSTVIAEQANLAGFIFKNQVLTSQASGYQTCGSTQTGPYPNLTIDGIYGVIKFLEKMFLTKDGITIKDDCGRNRMVFMFENGVPVLKFLNEDGSIAWQAGQNGYQPIYIETRPESYSPLYAIYKTTAPTGSSNEASLYFMNNICVYYSPQGTTQIYYRQPESVQDAVKGYQYDKGVQPNQSPEQNAANGKYFTNQDKTSAFMPDGFYCKNIYVTIEESTYSSTENILVAQWFQVINGVAKFPIEVRYSIRSLAFTQCTTQQTQQWQTTF